MEYTHARVQQWVAITDIAIIINIKTRPIRLEPPRTKQYRTSVDREIPNNTAEIDSGAACPNVALYLATIKQQSNCSALAILPETCCTATQSIGGKTPKKLF